MPELPEVEVLRRELAPILEGARIERVVLHRPTLRRAFPYEFDTRIAGASVLRLRRRAKYLLADLSSGETVIVHLGMSGWMRSEPAGFTLMRHDHVVFALTNGRAIVFNDPRRFGVMDLVATAQVEHVGPLAELGPEPLSDAFNAATLAGACARSRRPIKVALLDQTVIAGVGNIYASEALHLARLSPRLPAGAIATASGGARVAATRLAKAIRNVLARAIDQLERDDGRQRFRVYDREGERCPRARCGGTIRRITLGGRSTFYCPICQRSPRRPHALPSSRTRR
jgi:formamidopyrimidine-DNA glycosylase